MFKFGVFGKEHNNLPRASCKCYVASTLTQTNSSQFIPLGRTQLRVNAAVDTWLPNIIFQLLLLLQPDQDAACLNLGNCLLLTSGRTGRREKENSLFPLKQD